MHNLLLNKFAVRSGDRYK